MHWKTVLKAGAVVSATALAVTALTCCQKEDVPVSDASYLQTLDQSDIWTNSASASVPEYRIYHHVHAFLDECTIENGRAVSSEGKTRKVLFLGFDGMRADAALQLFEGTNVFDSALGGGRQIASGIRTLATEGGIYLAYCGGETGTDTEQTTSTSASWTSQFTGVWGASHGIKTNDDVKSLQYKTYILEYAEQGLHTALAFDWDQYLDVNLKEEVKLALSSPQLPVQFCDIDREIKDKLKKTEAETLELYNFVAPESPSPDAPFDSGMRDWVLARMAAGDDVVCGIFHNIDTAGHNYEFSPQNAQYKNAVYTCDTYAYEILQVVAARENLYNEEWLVVFANDHGGIGQGHGGQTLEERTTWIATNRPLDEAYFAEGYDGFTVQKK